MLEIEYVLLSAFHEIGKRTMVSEAINKAAESGHYPIADLELIARQLVERGLLKGNPSEIFLLRRLSITADGVRALEQHKMQLEQRQEELDQLAADRAEREISRKDQKKSKMLDLLLKIISAIAGFFAFLT